MLNVKYLILWFPYNIEFLWSQYELNVMEYWSRHGVMNTLEINGQSISQLVGYALLLCGQTTLYKWDSHDETDDYDTVLN